MIDIFIAVPNMIGKEVQYFLSLTDAKAYLDNLLGSGDWPVGKSNRTSPFISTKSMWENGEYSSDANIRKMALDKLSPEERRVLGVGGENGK